MNSKIPVSLKDFIITGRFGPITRAVTRRRVRELLGAPDWLGDLPDEETSYWVLSPPDWEEKFVPAKRKPCPKHARIWGYGSFSLCFDNGRLRGIFARTWTKLRSGKHVHIDYWILKDRLKRRIVERALGDLGVDYSVSQADDEPAVTILRTSSGVGLFFIEKPMKFGPKLGLHAIHKTMPCEWPKTGYFSATSEKVN